jgi:pantetheine-phosphate adenylyltransferase
MKVMVGGTFDPLHDGHKRLLDRSFAIAGSDGSVIIGLTTDSFVSKKSHPIRPFPSRRKELENYLQGRKSSAPWTIEPLNDRFGSAIDADFDAIIVSEETLPVAVEINKLRRINGRKKVDIHQISCVLADDGRWISSTRIYRGEIDVHGHMLH